MSILFSTFVVQKEQTFSPPETRIIGKRMLHIEWHMSSKEQLTEYREKLCKHIREKMGNSFSFSEYHLTLVLDLCQTYSYRDMRLALKAFDGIKTAHCLNGYIANIEFHM